MASPSLYLLAAGRSPNALHLSGYGFGEDPAATTLTDLAKHPDLAMYYSGTWLRILQENGQRGLASVEVKECFVYDEQYRSDIDYLGFDVSVRVPTDVHAAILDYVGPPIAGTLGVEWFRLLVRVPGPTFVLPERMEKAPTGYDRHQLRSLQRWDAKQLEITVLSDEAFLSATGKPVDQLLHHAVAETLSLNA